MKSEVVGALGDHLKGLRKRENLSALGGVMLYGVVRVVKHVGVSQRVGARDVRPIQVVFEINVAIGGLRYGLRDMRTPEIEKI